MGIDIRYTAVKLDATYWYKFCLADALTGTDYMMVRNLQHVFASLFSFTLAFNLALDMHSKSFKYINL